MTYRPPIVRQLDRLIPEVFDGSTPDHLTIEQNGAPVEVAFDLIGPSPNHLQPLAWQDSIRATLDGGKRLMLLISGRTIARQLVAELSKPGPGVYSQRCRVQLAECHAFVMIRVTDRPTDRVLRERLVIAKGELVGTWAETRSVPHRSLRA